MNREHRNQDYNNHYPALAVLAPKSFSNKEITLSAAEFISKFDSYKRINKWDDNEAALNFHLFLTDGPANWYTTLANDVKEDYNLLKDSFLTNFDSDKNSFYNTLSMFSRQQKPNESVDTYLTDLYKLFSNTDFSDTHKQIIFIKGLKPNLRDFTITSRPSTLLEAVQTAKPGR